MELIFGNVRCFSDDQRIPIRPLTLLVGENSSGKTTVLSLLQSVLTEDFPSIEKLFNRPPFELGGFDTIATNRGGQKGRSKEFYVGFEREATKLKVFFQSSRGSLVISRLKGEIPDAKVEYSNGPNGPEAKYHCHLGEGKVREFTHKIKDFKEFSGLAEQIRYGIYEYTFANSRDALEGGDDPVEVEMERLRELAMQFYFELFSKKPSVRAIAPLRTIPHRTYDTTIDDVSPGGDHVPRVLSRHSESDEKKGLKLFGLLERYGKEGGLFQKLAIRHLGKRPNDPFQVRIKTFGPDVNLTDVGYGVSQSLPILVDTWSAGNDGWVLIQQPEVHLHPRAQAALGSFFVEAVAQGDRRLVIETHSDYLIDRVRTEIANKKISPDEVQILFFDRSKFEASIWPISLDANGNVHDAPDCYRKFFLEEEMRVIRRGDR
jgi:energy-coupling factor transporter ATP-binding protein EcfA2